MNKAHAEDICFAMEMLLGSNADTGVVDGCGWLVSQ